MTARPTAHALIAHAAFALAAFALAPAALAGPCAPRAFDPDGGMEGGVPEAAAYCEPDAPGRGGVELHVGCMPPFLRLSVAAPEAAEESAMVAWTVGAETFRFYAHFEAGMGDHVAYLPVFFDDHPIFEALMAGRAAVVQVGESAPVGVPLTGSRAAIDAMFAACRALQDR